jgi:hypothetical protein
MPYEAKTKPTPVSPEAFIDSVDHPGRREDAHAVLALLTEATGQSPVMWGPSIIGFGKYRYTYDSGHSGEAPLVGFSPRKANLVLYMAAYDDARDDFLARLGKHKTGKGCIYLSRLVDVDTAVIAEMARWSMKTLKERHPE